ncbi:interactor of constitutive active ROPs 4-like [Silene latifolia]|uniref:interactor of constitutive active ROPs 4-like n=1 Tax=Silene latifolia TaxID=37657 RepID=UPI003D77EE5E
MPRTRGAEVLQRPSPTGPTPRGPRHLRTASSDSDPLHQRPMTERSPRILDRRSPKGSQSDPIPVHQKKLGTRITDLETQLVQAQHELKNLKHQLSSAEAAKRRAQEELNKKGIAKKPTVVRKVVKRVTKIQERNSRDSPDNEVSDVFEVPAEKMLMESKETHSLKECSELREEEKPSSCNEVGLKKEDVVVEQFKAMVDEKEKENQTLKQQLEEANSKVAAGQSKEEELTVRLRQLERELETSKSKEGELKDRLLESIASRETMDNEMKKMKVQTEQWKKAADAAASVLAGGGRISDRCASMDNHLNGIFEPPIDGFGGFLGSPGGGDDIDDGFGREKKRSSGIRMLGDLWKKKGQK